MSASPSELAVGGSVKATFSDSKIEMERPTSDEPSTVNIVLKNDDDKFPIVFRFMCNAAQYFSISSSAGFVVEPKQSKEVGLSQFPGFSNKSGCILLVVEASVCLPLHPSQNAWDVPSIWKEFVLPNDITRITIPIVEKVNRERVGDAEQKFCISGVIRSTTVTKPCCTKARNIKDKLWQERLCLHAFAVVAVILGLGFTLGRGFRRSGGSGQK